jgi:site-specific DNA-cytosine methylase
LKQVDAVADLPEILSAEEAAFEGVWRAQFYGFWEGMCFASEFDKRPKVPFVDTALGICQGLPTDMSPLTAAGAKSYKSPPLTNFQLRLRNYDLGGRVMLQYCHIPTESTYRKMLTEVDSESRRILPGTFPCVTTGTLGAHPTQRRSFSPRERLRAQGFPDYLKLRFGDLKKEDLYKESDFVSPNLSVNKSGRT